jgi:hypothetical protein
MPSNDPFDVDSLRLLGSDLAASGKPLTRPPPRHRPGETFLKGPIPWRWLGRSFILPGKALHVAILLWREAGCSRSRTVRFRLRNVTALGMHPDTAKRALRALARAGLVAIHYRPGQALEVTLLDTTG